MFKHLTKFKSETGSLNIFRYKLVNCPYQSGDDVQSISILDENCRFSESEVTVQVMAC